MGSTRSASYTCLQLTLLTSYVQSCSMCGRLLNAAAALVARASVGAVNPEALVAPHLSMFGTTPECSNAFTLYNVKGGTEVSPEFRVEG